MNRALQYGLIIIFIVMLSACTRKPLTAKDNEAMISIHSVNYHLIIVDTDASRAQGLSGRKSLASDYGMFFVFPYKGTLSFWMKDMNFPIDIIFINDNKIVSIFDSVPPPKPGQKLSALPLYTSTSPANYVLEVNAGEAKRHGFKVGDAVVVDDGAF